MATEITTRQLPLKLKPSEDLVKQFQDQTKNAVSTVTEYCQKNSLKHEFQEIHMWNTRHSGYEPGKFHCQCFIQDRPFPVGEGATKKAAKYDAAAKAFTALIGALYVKPKAGKKRNSRSKRRKRTSTQSSFYAEDEPYPDWMLKDARNELQKQIGLKQNTIWNGLKIKCGINQALESRNRTGSWGDASDKFIFSSLPLEYMDEFTVSEDLTEFDDEVDHASHSETQNLLALNAEATATAVEDLEDTQTHNIDTDNSDHELSDANKTNSIVHHGKIKSDNEGANGTNSKKRKHEVLDDDIEEEEIVVEVIINEIKTQHMNTDDRSKKQCENITKESVSKAVAEKRVYEVNTTELRDKQEEIENPDTKEQHENNTRGAVRKTVVEKKTIKINASGLRGKQEEVKNSHTKEQHERTSTELIPKTAVEKQVNKVKSSGLKDKQEELENSHTKDTGTKPYEILAIDLDEGDASVPSTSASTTEPETQNKKYKCDLCDAVSANSKRMMGHLKEAMHYSASLVTVDEKGIPEVILQQRFLTNNAASYKSLIPVCPHSNCSLIFLHIYACASHYNLSHRPDEGAVYALAELLKEETIKSDNLHKVCKICSAEFSTSQLLMKHMKNDQHLPFTPEKNSEAIFLCCQCKLTFANFYRALGHCSSKRRLHFSDFRVLHISPDRITRSILPFRQVVDSWSTLIKCEMENLKVLKKQAGKAARHRINERIRELLNLRCDTSLTYEPGKLNSKTVVKKRKAQSREDVYQKLLRRLNTPFYPRKQVP